MRLLSVLFVCSFLFPLAFAAGESTELPESAKESFKLGEDFYRMKDWDNAAMYYKKVWEVAPDTETAAVSLLRLGMCRYFQKRYEAAVTDFRLLIDRRPNSNYIREAYFFAAKSSFNYGDYASTAYYLAESLSYGSDSPYYKRSMSGLRRVMRERLSPEEIRRMVSQLRIKNDTGEALHIQAKDLMGVNDKERATVILFWLDQNFPSAFYAAEVKKLLEGARSGLTRMTGKIGVLAPMPPVGEAPTDAYAREKYLEAKEMAVYGSEALNGVKLAVDEYNKLHSSNPITVVVRDSGFGDKVPDGTVSELLDTERVPVIIGPLFNGQMRNLVSMTDYAGVALVSPGVSDTSLSTLSPLVFLTSLTTDEQGRDMARYAVGKKGWKRVAVLAPNSKLGQELGSAFADEAKKLGGNVVANVSYPEIAYKKSSTGKEKGRGNVDYSGEVRRVRAAHPQAIYIPGYYDELVLITSQLSFSDVASVLLGANGWNENRLIRMCGKYVEGAYFTAAYFSEAPNAAVRNFHNSYLNKYGAKPGYLAAQSYDATRMVLDGLDRGAKDGKQLAGYLKDVKSYNGVSGQITLKDANGKPSKEASILTIRQGVIVEAEKN